MMSDVPVPCNDHDIARIHHVARAAERVGSVQPGIQRRDAIGDIERFEAAAVHQMQAVVSVEHIGVGGAGIGVVLDEVGDVARQRRIASPGAEP